MRLGDAAILIGLVILADGRRRAELRAEAARMKHSPPEPALVPAGVELPRELVDVGGHDASGEGR